jgi:ankyrin repeat protein
MSLITRTKFKCGTEDHDISVWQRGDEESCGREHIIIAKNGNLICCENHEVELELTISDLTGEEPSGCLKFVATIESLLSGDRFKIRWSLDGYFGPLTPFMLQVLGDVNYSNERYLSRLAIRGDLESVKKLRKLGASMRFGGDQLEPLARGYCFSPTEHRFTIIKYFVKHSHKITTAQLNRALASSSTYPMSPMLVKYFIKLGADPNAAIQNACSRGILSLVKYLIQKGADIKKTPKNLAVIMAVQNKHLNVVKYLIKKGAHLKALPERKHDIKSSPLGMAIHHHDVTMVELLLEPTYKQDQYLVERALDFANGKRKKIHTEEVMVKTIYDFIQEKEKLYQGAK